MKQKICVSSRDVAREAGVSQATVSYVLNNVKNIKIKPETREAVLRAVEKLNYHPNQIARGMKLNRSMSIGVVTDRSTTNFYLMKTLEGIKDGTQQHNYSITLMFNKSGNIADMEYIKYYSSNRLDGIIFAFASLSEEAVDYLREKDIPFITVDVVSSGRDVYEVCTDHLQHIGDVLRYYKSKGIATIGYTGSGTAQDNRAKAFKQVAYRYGYNIMDNHMMLCPHDDEEIIRFTTQLFRSPERPQAILAGSPRYGMFAVKCANMLNIKLPEELKIIALGSSNFYTVVHPSLSAVEVPLYDMGFNSAEKLFEIMMGHEVEKTTVLPSQLVIRDSS